MKRLDLRLAAVQLPDVEWLTVGALARLLDVDYETVHSGVDRGELPKPHRRTNLIPSRSGERCGTERGARTLGRSTAVTVFSVAELAARQQPSGPAT
jgi:hypothetical protein